MWHKTSDGLGILKKYFGVFNDLTRNSQKETKNLVQFAHFHTTGLDKILLKNQNKMGQ